MAELTHIDPLSGPHMVDVGDKPSTQREAVARGRVTMQHATFQAILANATPKGDVLSTARIAGIMAAKHTSNLVPMCHPIPLSYIGVDLTPGNDEASIEIETAVRTTGQTGAEMEALTAVSVAALTVYDMCKALDKGMHIEAVRLVRKSGGQSGNVVLEN